MSTTHSFCNCGSGGGVQPVFSASGPDAGATNAIAWGLDISGSNGVLYAFNANSLSTQLYSSSTNNSRDQAPPSVKFTLPVVANGRVYVAGQGVVAAYGLLPQ
jgi:outer membrane protein assembly factor BamB